jgi:hypothetical protein
MLSITKMSIGVPPVNRFTAAMRVLSQMWPHQRWSLARDGEWIMSKTNSDSRGVRESGELTNDELAPVVGGTWREAQAALTEAKRAFAQGDMAGGFGFLGDYSKAIPAGGGGW